MKTSIKTSDRYISLSKLANQWKLNRQCLVRLIHERLIPPIINDGSDDFLVEKKFVSKVKARLVEIGYFNNLNG